MPFCPRCRCEYNVGVELCVDCHVPLVLYRPDRRSFFEFDADEWLAPVGAAVCMLIALGLFGLHQAATAGQVSEPLASLIAGQPVCMNVFYVIAAIMSALVLLISVVRILTGQR